MFGLFGRKKTPKKECATPLPTWLSGRAEAQIIKAMTEIAKAARVADDFCLSISGPGAVADIRRAAAELERLAARIEGDAARDAELERVLTCISVDFTPTPEGSALRQSLQQTLTVASGTHAAMLVVRKRGQREVLVCIAAQEYAEASVAACADYVEASIEYFALAAGGISLAGGGKSCAGGSWSRIKLDLREIVQLGYVTSGLDGLTIPKG